MSDFSMITADRSTQIEIVTLSLVFAIIAIGIVIGSRLASESVRPGYASLINGIAASFPVLR
jgi:hypothetical protein